MPILGGIGASIISGVAGNVLGEVFDRGVDLYKSYLNKEISEEQYEAEKVKYIQEGTARIEEAWAEAAAKIFESAQETIRQSFKAKSWFTRNAWAFVVFSQTFVLLWYQLLLPWFIYAFDLPLTGEGAFPRTGDDLLKWAYLIITACLGIGVYQMRKEGKL